MNIATPLAACLAVATVATAAPAFAQNEGLFDVARVRAETPACNDHPNWNWVGRVSGQMTVQNDRGAPVSFVGCFPTQASCETWKGRASGIIDRRIIQYSCAPRA